MKKILLISMLVLSGNFLSYAMNNNEKITNTFDYSPKTNSFYIQNSHDNPSPLSKIPFFSTCLTKIAVLLFTKPVPKPDRELRDMLKGIRNYVREYPSTYKEKTRLFHSTHQEKIGALKTLIQAQIERYDKQTTYTKRLHSGLYHLGIGIVATTACCAGVYGGYRQLNYQLWDQKTMAQSGICFFAGAACASSAFAHLKQAAYDLAKCPFQPFLKQEKYKINRTLKTILDELSSDE